MKILNLMYPEESEIKFKISHFPDGQQDVVIDNSPDEFGDKLPGYYYIAGKSRVYALNSIEIKSRFNSFKDLELIICVTKALRRIGIKEIHLYIPYLLGARSDRQFVEGANSYLVDVIAPIINSLEFESVTVVDVHSDVAAACIKNLKVVDNATLVKRAVVEIYNAPMSEITFNMDGSEPFVLISPDSGALKKIYKVANAIGYKKDVIVCSKSRDENGILSKVRVPYSPENNHKDVVIIDDICDGGATFINIARELKDNGWSGKIYLIVTHGIFSKLFKELSQYFDGIYTTDSIRSDFDWEQKERDNTEICKIIKL